MTQHPETDPSRAPIAVVGVAALFPGSSDAQGFWRDILAGRDLLGDVPASHWNIADYYDEDPAAPDKTYGKRGGFLAPVDFDPVGFGLPPNAVPTTDPEQLLALIVANRVLEDAARGQFREIDRDRISVILGVASATSLLGHMVGRMQRPSWEKGLREAGFSEDQVKAACDRIAGQYLPWQESTFPGLLGNVVAGRIANRFDLGGTNSVVDAACASSLSAVSMAVNELRLGRSDMVITGGVDAMNDIVMYMCFSKTPAMSRSGDCRPFSDNSDGTMLGEGIGMMALRRLADAERDGNRIYAVLRGIGTSSDGRFKSIYAPRPDGQAKALRRAYENAGYGPDTVELVEAHGTGTAAGDAAEVESLRSVFDGMRGAATQWCALGSVKSQIGHTKAAAGAAGLFKAVMALHHKVLPPTAKVERPNPALGLEASALYLGTEAAPWISGAAHPRRASVSAFGFGGSNFHATLEEYRGPNPAGRLRAMPSELVTLSAENPAALAERCRAMAADTGTLAFAARTSQLEARAGAPERVAVVAASEDELRERLLAAANAIERGGKTGPGIYRGSGAAEPLAFLFPGQGSQYVRMGADLAMAFDDARAVWDRSAQSIFDGARVHEKAIPHPAGSDAERARADAELRATEWAQPALGMTSAAQLAILARLGVTPAAVGGHSFGEVTALHAAGVLDESGLLQTARRRGELMAAAAAAPGAMTAVAHPVAELRDILEEIGAQVVLANHNGPRQAVLSGSVPAIEEVERRLAARSIPATRLPVATAFHSEIVAGSAAPFLAWLENLTFRPAQAPVYSNTYAAPYPNDPAEMRRWLAGQLARPVRFAEQVEAMYRQGIRTFVEVGPGSEYWSAWSTSAWRAGRTAR